MSYIDDIKDALTDIEIAKIEQFTSDEVMIEAVRKVVFGVLNARGGLVKGKKIKPTFNGALGLVSLSASGKAVISNEELGADIRAYYQGISLLESGFDTLTKIKVARMDIPTEENPAI